MGKDRHAFLFSISLLFTFWGNTSFSQKDATAVLQAEHFTLEDGLSHRNVKGICQDQRGMMWFGTAYGLNRFDGYEFKWFTAEKNGLAYNDIHNIHTDEKGNIWVVYGFEEVRAIDIFDPVTESVQSFEELFGQEAPFSLGDVIHYTTGPDKQFAFLVPGKIVLYQHKFTEIPLQGESKELKGKIFFRKQELWMWTYAYEDKNYRFLQINEKGISREIDHPMVADSTYTEFYEVKDDGYIRISDCNFNTHKDNVYQRYYEITPDGKIIRDPVAEKIFGQYHIRIATTRNFIRKIGSNYWVNGNSEGFWVIPSTPFGKPILLSETYPELEKTNGIFEDNKGMVWVNTEFGVFSFQFKENRFRNFFSQRNGVNGFPFRELKTTGSGQEKTLWGIVEDRSELWKVDMRTGKETMDRYVTGSRWALHKTGDDELLFVSGKGIGQMDAHTGETTKVYPLDFLDNDTYIWKIHLDKYGKLWFDITNDGTLLFVDHGKLNTFRGWTGSAGETYLYQFIENETDTAWLVTNKGLFRLNIKNGQVVERFWRDGKGRHHLPFDNVHHVWMEPDHFWLATAQTGLVKWHPDRGVIQRYTRADGLSNNTLYAAYPDDYGNIWLPSDYGINVLEEATGRVRTYTTKDGICHNEFNRISHCRDEDGYLYFGTLDGVTSFHPRDLIADTTQFQPPMAITVFQQFDGKKGKLVDKTAELIRTHSITLKPDDPLIRLSFALLSYEQLENVQYAYLIEGVDKDWTYQTGNTLRLGRLPYGEHLLRIKGQAASGQWSADELQIRIQAVRPFYLRTWFFILILLAVAGAFIFFVRYRERTMREQRARLERTVQERTATIEQQKEELKSLDELKSRFFANVSHELRTPLTLVAGPVQTLLKGNIPPPKQKKLLNMANRGIKELRHLINEILDLGKMEAGKMTVAPEPTHVVPFFRRYRSQFESLADRNEVDYQFNIDVKENTTVQLDREKFRQILFNLLSNAFKFTPSGGNIRVDLHLADGQLRLEVADTGKGIHPDDLPHVFDRYFQSNRPDAVASGGTGIGLAICQEYARLLGGSIAVQSTLGKGTRFEVDIPVETAELTADPEQAEDVPEAEAPLTLVEMAPAETLAARALPVADKDTRPLLLVVEDTLDLQAYIRTILEDSYKVVTARNGQEALDLLYGKIKTEHTSEESKPALPVDLVISDLMMPEMDGYQLLTELKANELTRSIPVIMLTARAGRDDRLKALRIGVDDYLTKPFDEEELLVRIANLLENQQARQEATLEEHPGIGEVAPGLSVEDQDWLHAFEEYCEQNLSNSQLSVVMLADEFAMSMSTLLRQLKRLTGLTPQKFLMEVRLEKARQLFAEKRFSSVSRVAREVGYRDVQSFSKSFKSRYGKNPSELITG